jgi:hypothetical protein
MSTPSAVNPSKRLTRPCASIANPRLAQMPLPRHALPNGPADSTQETEYLVKAISSAPLEQRLREEALRLGFATCGIAPAADDPARAARLRQWLADGRHGSMEWMETRSEQRQGPQSLWPQAQSVIALGMSYAPRTIRWRWPKWPIAGAFRSMPKGWITTT